MTGTSVPPTMDQGQGLQPPGGSRRVSMLLGIGIFIMPYVFAWWLLRPGFSTFIKILSFGWAALVLYAFTQTNPPLPDSVNQSGQPVMAANDVPDPEAARVAEAEAVKARLQAEKIREVKRNPEDFLSFKNTSTSIEGFGTVLMLSGTIENTSEFQIKDPRIVCEIAGPSGTKISEVRETLYEIVPPNGNKRFRSLNMGFIGSTQFSQYRCMIRDAEAIVP